MTFSELNLAEPILRAIEAEKYTTPSPIQKQAIPHLLAGRDILGCAQTGTGKTAAFALPIIQAVYNRPKAGKKRAPTALVLAPTRELAAQVAASFSSYGRFTGLKTVAIFGGVSQNPQATAIRNGVDVLVATPGRLMDLIRQRLCDLRHVDTLVLDEADHMLDLGFIHDVKAIVAMLPKKRQTLLFSATMPKAIASLAESVLDNPVNVAVTPVSSAVDTVTQSIYHVAKADKVRLLVKLLNTENMESTLVFSRTKHGADRICKMLHTAGITAKAIHGNKSQTARKDALAAFKKGKLGVLVATDIAARGIDINGLSHVVNFDLPEVPETYVHRIGRTGRAGRQGVAFAFCDPAERLLLRGIERLISKRITTADPGLPVPVKAQAPATEQETKPHTDERRQTAKSARLQARPQKNRQPESWKANRAPRPHAPGKPFARRGGKKKFGGFAKASASEKPRG